VQLFGKLFDEGFALHDVAHEKYAQFDCRDIATKKATVTGVKHPGSSRMSRSPEAAIGLTALRSSCCS
jgi:hypothetical protein